MRMKVRLQNSVRHGRLSLVMASCLLLGGLVTPLLAGERYLVASQFDGIALLPPPPAPDSAEQAADLASVRAVFKAATPAERRHAERGANLSLYNFAMVIGDDFQPGKYPKVDLLFETLKTNISDTITTPKNHWQRLRPYQLDPELVLGKSEKSSAYPSGHSTRGTMQALVLAEIFPEKREIILDFGRQIGWDRVIIGKHFPTDVFAGRVLGKAIVRELQKNPAFQRDLAAAKAEVAAAKK